MLEENNLKNKLVFNVEFILDMFQILFQVYNNTFIYLLNSNYLALNFYLLFYFNIRLNIVFLKKRLYFSKYLSYPQKYRLNTNSFKKELKLLGNKLTFKKIYNKKKFFFISSKLRKLFYTYKKFSRKTKRITRSSLLNYKNYFLNLNKRKPAPKQQMQHVYKHFRLSILKLFTILSYMHIVSRYSRTVLFGVLNRVFSSTRLVNFFFKKYYIKSYSKFSFFKCDIFNLFKTNSLKPLFSTNLFFSEKQKRTTYYFFDGNKSPLKAMGGARSVHGIFSLKKTLRNVHYKVFLKKELKKDFKFFLKDLNLFFFLKIYKLCISFYQSILLLATGCFWINKVQIFKNKLLTCNDVIRFSYFPGLVFFFKKIVNKLIKRNRKFKKQGYIVKSMYFKKWVKKKKNKLKNSQWRELFNVSYSQNYIFDFHTFTCIVLLKETPVLFNYKEPNINTSTVKKLYKWKFRAS